MLIYTCVYDYADTDKRKDRKDKSAEYREFLFLFHHSDNERDIKSVKSYYGKLGIVKGII